MMLCVKSKRESGEVDVRLEVGERSSPPRRSEAVLAASISTLVYGEEEACGDTHICP